MTKPDLLTPEGRLAAEPLLQFFEYGHLPVDKQAVSMPFGDLAIALVHILPRNPERTVALRKLLEAKDCAVRSSFMKMPSQTVAFKATPGERVEIPFVAGTSIKVEE